MGREKRLVGGDVGGVGAQSVLGVNRLIGALAKPARRGAHAFALAISPLDARSIHAFLPRRICRARVGQGDANGFGCARHGDDFCRHGGVFADLFCVHRRDIGAI